MSILVATDFSDNAVEALHAASYLAQKRDVPLTVVHCLKWQTTVPEEQRPDEEFFNEYLQDVLEKLESHYHESLAARETPDQLDFDVYAGNAESEIVEAVDADDHELAVLGATGTGRVANVLLGSTPEAVVRRSSAPVLVVPPEIEAGGYGPIVAPVDLTPCSRESLELAASVAREHGARLTVLHVAPRVEKMGPTPIPPSAPLPSAENLREHATDRVEKFLGDFSLEGIDSEVRIETGSPSGAIEATIEDLDADLTVMGTHGKRGAERLFLGSTTTKIVRNMPCSVMTLRYREDS